MSQQLPLRELGNSGLRVTPVGLGTWQFSAGSKSFAARYWQGIEKQTINDIVQCAVEGGINWFDTAEYYGNGMSEQNLARALKQAGKQPGDVLIATKWWPVLKSAASILSSFPDRERYLEGFRVDLHQVHQPLSISSIDRQMHAMADLLDQGRIRAVGVSNFSAKAMRKAHAVLQSRGYGLASNQMRYSLLYRDIDNNGVMDAASELGISIIAWSPLEQGILTGKFHRQPERVSGLNWMRKAMFGFSDRKMRQSRPLIELLESCAARHGVTAAEVALNWLLQIHGDSVVVIPGASSVNQVRANIGAMHFTLPEDDVHALDTCSRSITGNES